MGLNDLSRFRCVWSCDSCRASGRKDSPCALHSLSGLGSAASIALWFGGGGRNIADARRLCGLARPSPPYADLESPASADSGHRTKSPTWVSEECAVGDISARNAGGRTRQGRRRAPGVSMERGSSPPESVQQWRRGRRSGEPPRHVPADAPGQAAPA